jgi:hypothetical protein
MMDRRAVRARLIRGPIKRIDHQMIKSSRNSLHSTVNGQNKAVRVVIDQEETEGMVTHDKQGLQRTHSLAMAMFMAVSSL